MLNYFYFVVLFRLLMARGETKYWKTIFKATFLVLFLITGNTQTHVFGHTDQYVYMVFFII